MGSPISGSVVWIKSELSGEPSDGSLVLQWSGIPGFAVSDYSVGVSTEFRMRSLRYFAVVVVTTISGKGFRLSGIKRRNSCRVACILLGLFLLNKEAVSISFVESSSPTDVVLSHVVSDWRCLVSSDFVVVKESSSVVTEYSVRCCIFPGLYLYIKKLVKMPSLWSSPTSSGFVVDVDVIVVVDSEESSSVFAFSSSFCRGIGSDKPYKI